MGWLDKLQDGAQFDGLTNKGFDYNGAWGGPVQNGNSMNYYKAGLDFEPKTISQSGTIIEDEMGQWNHPGEVTRIPSNNITMRDVGYPVLGVPNKGKPKMMKPGKNYKFPEASSVTEYPQLQNGNELEQLLNFTNTPDKRWLDNL